MSIKKNGAVISVIVLLLFVAVYLNWQYSRGAASDVSGAKLGDTSTAGDISEDSDRLANGKYSIQLNDLSDTSTAEDGYIVSGNRTGELSTYFDETRLDRQQTRDEAINLLQSTLTDEKAESDVKSVAKESISVLASNAVTESRIESLVIAKGFVECVAIIDNTGVNVVVLPKEEGLEASDVSKIKDIVMAQAAVGADKIRVTEAK